MIARAPTEIGLRVTFHRDDLLIDSAVVPTGEDARDEALLIISRQDALQPATVWPSSKRPDQPAGCAASAASREALSAHDIG
jgi:hypothetical protein